MLLQYVEVSGMQMAVEVGKIPLTIGRSSDADLVLKDDKLSRLHCRISYEKGIYYLEDMGSKNGTTVNGHTIKRTAVKSGDRILIGDTRIILKDFAHPGTNTVLCDVQDRMAQGKGYNTIMREIIKESDEPEEN